MFLRCSVCAATQPVNTADEADEDPRTQWIRKTFRAEHVASCGADAVKFFTAAQKALVDLPTPAWMSAAPPGVTLGGDGFFTTRVVRDGALMHVRVCEDCWEPIPRYVDFPVGLTSSESDREGAAKIRYRSMDTNEPSVGEEHLAKAVCLPCYYAAFARMYPAVICPPMRPDVIGDQRLERRAVLEHMTVIDGGTAGEPLTR